MFDALDALGRRQWAIAMRLCHRAGLRWGELVALQAQDIEVEPARIVHVRRAVEQPTRGPARLKAPKDGKVRTSIFPKSLTNDLGEIVPRPPPARDQRLCCSRARRIGSCGTALPANLDPGRRRRRLPMTAPLQRTGGYGQTNNGWRWTGAAKWSPHDLRHVAACWMLFDLGLDPAVVADKLGHADPNLTIKRYIGVRGDPDTAAMAVTDDC
jgi:integrase